MDLDGRGKGMAFRGAEEVHSPGLESWLCDRGRGEMKMNPRSLVQGLHWLTAPAIFPGSTEGKQL